jgi:perosamine synthetase
MTVKLYPRLIFDIGWRDLCASLLALPFLPPRTQIIDQIQTFWPSSHHVLVSLCARTAFASLLEVLQLPTGSEILVSAINIRHMVEIIEHYGCIPVPVDIDKATFAPDLQQFKAAISARTRVVLIAHLYGAIVPLSPYAEVCQARGLLLVEDCAQAFAGQQYLGHPQADVSLFSFGPIKSCTALGGAVTLLRDPQLAQTMQELEQRYPTKSNGWFGRRLLKYLGLKFLAEPTRLGLLMIALQWLNLETDPLINSLTRGFAAGDILCQLRYQPPTGLLNLLQRRLQSVTDSHFHRRAHIAQTFLAQLQGQVTLPGQLATQHTYWLVPILVKEPSALIQKLQAAGFDATRGTTSLRAIGGTTPIAQQLMEQVVYLPVSANLPDVELTRLAGLVNDFAAPNPGSLLETVGATLKSKIS